MVYNSEKRLCAQKIAHKNKEDKEQEKIYKNKERETALFKKAEEVCIIFREKGHLLDRLNVSEVQDISRFLCCIESEGNGESYSKRIRSKKKLKKMIAL